MSTSMPDHETPTGDDARCAVCGTARGEHRLTEHSWTAAADEAMSRRGSAADLPAVTPPSTVQLLAEAAARALGSAVEAARLAGRFEAVLDEHPGEASREQYSRADSGAVAAYRRALAAVDALAEAQR